MFKTNQGFLFNEIMFGEHIVKSACERLLSAAAPSRGPVNAYIIPATSTYTSIYLHTCIPLHLYTYIYCTYTCAYTYIDRHTLFYVGRPLRCALRMQQDV